MRCNRSRRLSTRTSTATARWVLRDDDRGVRRDRPQAGRGHLFYLCTRHGHGPQLKLSNAAVTVGQFGAWKPIGAAPTASGGLVVWKNGAADQYLVWTVDGSGNWLSQSAVLSGASTALQVLEPGFSQDLNGVGGITARTVIESRDRRRWPGSPTPSSSRRPPARWAGSS